MSRRLQRLKSVAVIGGMVGAICLASYPIIIHPMLYPEEYQRIQAITRKDIKQEDIQPGNMKVWTDPFGRSKNKE